VIVSVLVALLLLIGLYVASHRLHGLQALVALLGLGVGMLFVVFPGLTSLAAAKLNVGRGSDLLLYFGIVGGLFVAAHYYFRFKRQEAILAEIVRALALASPFGPDLPAA